MIFTDRTVIVQKGTSSINDTIVLYRGDREVEIRFTLNESSPFKFGSGVTPNIIEKTEAAYGQLVIKVPGDKAPIFSEITATKKGAITFTITAEMIDEITEVGNYTFQIRLLDENKEGRVTIPEVVNGIEVREPIATEDISDTNEVGIAAVGYALTTAGTTEDTFDSQGNYNKTTWGTGDRITAAKLNKIEVGIEGVNQKVSNIDVINDTTASAITTYSGNKIENIKENLSSQIENVAKQIEGVGRPTEEQINTSVNNALKNGNVKCNSNYNNPFENLNIVLFGDSITDLENNNITKWVQPFRNLITCKSFKDYARGYCTWTFKSDTSYNITDSSNSNIGNNVIWNQLNKLKNDVNNGTVNTPNIIMILAGTNDALQSKALGDINTAFSSASQGTDVTKLTTLAQSVRYVCDDIYNTYPNCKIIICTPLPIGTASDYPKSVEVRNMLISCANVLNLDIIDQTYKSGIVWYREAQSNIYYKGDGIHLNDLGGELIANFIYKELLNLPCFYEKTVKSINLSTAETTKILNSITATFVQGDNVIYTTDSLDTLKRYLVVKANYNDNTSENITGYTLSGTLTEGTSTITVLYEDKTSTFTVTVTERTAPVTTYTITNNLSHATNSNNLSSITEGSSYTATIQISAGYTLDVIRITMGETDITNTVYSNGNISIPNVTGNIIITVTTQLTSTVRNYLRENLIGNLSSGIWENAVMIPNLAIPNTGKVVSFDCNSCANGDLYVFLATKSDNNFTPFYVKRCTLSSGNNSIDINYTPNDSIAEYYVGFKSVVRNSIGLNTNRNSATSTNQQFTEYYQLENSSYIPEVGKVINTDGIYSDNIGMAFDCMLKVKL